MPPVVVLAHKKRAASASAAPERAKRTPDDWYALARDTADLGPMHVLIAENYKDARSRLSMLSMDLLTMVLTPYLSNRDGHGSLPGVMQLPPPGSMPVIVDFHKWGAKGRAHSECLHDTIVVALPDNAICIRSNATPVMPAEQTQMGRAIVAQPNDWKDRAPPWWHQQAGAPMPTSTEAVVFHENIRGPCMTIAGERGYSLAEFRLGSVDASCASPEGLAKLVGNFHGAGPLAMCADARGVVCMAFRKGGGYTNLIVACDEKRPPANCHSRMDVRPCSEHVHRRARRSRGAHHDLGLVRRGYRARDHRFQHWPRRPK